MLLPGEPGCFHQRPPARHRPSGSAQVLEEGDRVAGAAIARPAHPRQHDERLQDVVVPERRVAQRRERRVDRLAVRELPEEAVLEEELRGSVGSAFRVAISRRGRVLVEAPHGRQRLVERRASPRRLLVAVPAAVGPLPLDQRLGEQLDARIVREAEAGAHGQGVPLLRAAAPRQAVDDSDTATVARPCEPAEHGLGGRDAARLAGRHAELDERHEPPVRPGPLGVGWPPKPPSGC